LDQLPFMMMSHPLIPGSLAPASVTMAMGQMNRLSTLASMANVAQLHANPPARAPTSVIKDTPSPSPSLEEPQMSSNHSSSVSSSPLHNERTTETTRQTVSRNLQREYKRGRQRLVCMWIFYGCARG
ncbi:hypothetical protein XENOCAPTIV_030237, partial [Xenoophorus captivus]